MDASKLSQFDIVTTLALINLLKSSVTPEVYKTLLAILSDYDPGIAGNREKTTRYIRLLLKERSLVSSVLMSLPKDGPSSSKQSMVPSTSTTICQSDQKPCIGQDKLMLSGVPSQGYADNISSLLTAADCIERLHAKSSPVKTTSTSSSSSLSETESLTTSGGNNNTNTFGINNSPSTLSGFNNSSTSCRDDIGNTSVYYGSGITTPMNVGTPLLFSPVSDITATRQNANFSSKLQDSEVSSREPNKPIVAVPKPIFPYQHLMYQYYLNLANVQMGLQRNIPVQAPFPWSPYLFQSNQYVSPLYDGGMAHQMTGTFTSFVSDNVPNECLDLSKKQEAAPGKRNNANQMKQTADRNTKDSAGPSYKSVVNLKKKVTEMSQRKQNFEGQSFKPSKKVGPYNSKTSVGVASFSPEAPTLPATGNASGIIGSLKDLVQKIGVEDVTCMDKKKPSKIRPKFAERIHLPVTSCGSLPSSVRDATADDLPVTTGISTPTNFKHLNVKSFPYCHQISLPNGRGSFSCVTLDQSDRCKNEYEGDRYSSFAIQPTQRSSVKQERDVILCTENKTENPLTTQLLTSKIPVKAFAIQPKVDAATNRIAVHDKALLNSIKQRLQSTTSQSQQPKKAVKRALSESDLPVTKDSQSNTKKTCLSIDLSSFPAQCKGIITVTNSDNMQTNSQKLHSSMNPTLPALASTSGVMCTGPQRGSLSLLYVPAHVAPSALTSTVTTASTLKNQPDYHLSNFMNTVMREKPTSCVDGVTRIDSQCNGDSDGDVSRRFADYSDGITKLDSKASIDMGRMMANSGDGVLRLGSQNNMDTEGDMGRRLANCYNVVSRPGSQSSGDMDRRLANCYNGVSRPGSQISGVMDRRLINCVDSVARIGSKGNGDMDMRLSNCGDNDSRIGSRGNGDIGRRLANCGDGVTRPGSQSSDDMGRVLTHYDDGVFSRLGLKDSMDTDGDLSRSSASYVIRPDSKGSVDTDSDLADKSSSDLEDDLFVNTPHHLKLNLS